MIFDIVSGSVDERTRRQESRQAPSSSCGAAWGDIQAAELLSLQFDLRLEHRTGGPSGGILRQGCALSCATDTRPRPSSPSRRRREQRANQAHFLRLQALRRVGERARCLMACSLLCLLEAQAGWDTCKYDEAYPVSPQVRNASTRRKSTQHFLRRIYYARQA